MPPAPVMPTVINTGGAAQVHQDHVGDSGEASETWFAMVHQPVPMKEAMKKPKAKAAVDAVTVVLSFDQVPAL